MSQARWKYWIVDGVAHIHEEDLPPPYKAEASMPDPLKISVGMRRNPDFVEFQVEIKRVTGSDRVIVHQKDNPGDPRMNGK